MKEIQFITKVRRLIDSEYRENCVFHWKNNNATLPGLPDLEVIINGVTYYLECKYEKDFPKRDTSLILSHEFTSPQYKFYHLITRAGGKCAGLVGVGNRIYLVFDKLISAHNFSVEDLHKYGHPISHISDIFSLMNGGLP